MINKKHHSVIAPFFNYLQRGESVCSSVWPLRGKTLHTASSFRAVCLPVENIQTRHLATKKTEEKLLLATSVCPELHHTETHLWEQIG